MDDLDNYTNEMNKNSTQTGGINLNTSFFEYITTVSGKEKALLTNILQYGGLSILPILVLLKLLKMYVPEEDPLKGSPEIAIEVLIQLGVIMIALFFIHKLVIYVPTYSKVDYEHINLLTIVLPLFFLMFAMDTNVSAKLNILFDRLLIALGIKKENYENQTGESKNDRPSTKTSTTTMSQHDYGVHSTDPVASRLIDGFPTKREPSVSSQQPTTQSNYEMMMPSEPMAANEGFMGSMF